MVLNSLVLRVFKLLGSSRPKRKLQNKLNVSVLLIIKLKLQLIKLINKLQKQNRHYKLYYVGNMLRKSGFRKRLRKLLDKATKQALCTAKQAEIQAKNAAKLAEKSASKPKRQAPLKKKHMVVSNKGRMRKGVKVTSPQTSRTQAIVLPQQYR
jgi:hypothetical protein